MTLGISHPPFSETPARKRGRHIRERSNRRAAVYAVPVRAITARRPVVTTRTVSRALRVSGRTPWRSAWAGVGLTLWLGCAVRKPPAAPPPVGGPGTIAAE